MNVFNLKKFKKVAFYEGAKGLTSERAWQNCYKLKSVDGKMPPHEAWECCRKEFNDNNGKGEWSLKYASKNINYKK